LEFRLSCSPSPSLQYSPILLMIFPLSSSRPLFSPFAQFAFHWFPNVGTQPRMPFFLPPNGNSFFLARLLGHFFLFLPAKAVSWSGAHQFSDFQTPSPARADFSLPFCLHLRVSGLLLNFFLFFSESHVFLPGMLF